MRAVPKWVEKIHEPGDKSYHASIHAVCFHPEGLHVIAGASEKLLVYDAVNGNLLETLRGHKETIYAVAYARDGNKYTSGSTDKSVIIWTNKFEGMLKYSHSDAVQCLSFNPVSHQLARCAVSDFALWSAEQKAVQKYKTPARINACAWTNDGQYLALGLANGCVSIRNKVGNVKNRIERSGRANSPIFGVAWNPPGNLIERFHKKFCENSTKILNYFKSIKNNIHTENLLNSS